VLSQEGTGLPDLIQTLRILGALESTIHGGAKNEGVWVIIKEARLTIADVELEVYVQPTQNLWWKYRQTRAGKPVPLSDPSQTIRL